MVCVPSIYCRLAMDICLTHQTSYCTQIPGDGYSIFVWPRFSSVQDQYCSSLTIGTAQFNACYGYCGSDYSFVLENGEVCLQNSSLLWQLSEPLKVYYVYQTNLCSPTQCVVNSIASSYWITRQSKYKSHADAQTAARHTLRFFVRIFCIVANHPAFCRIVLPIDLSCKFC